jgi:cysteine-rich repeat protein
LLVVAACGTSGEPGEQRSELGRNVCGDGRAIGNEECDGADLRGKACTDYGYNSGTLRCNPQCVYDLSDCAIREICDNGIDDDGNGDKDCDDAACFDAPVCAVCGDGVRTANEECDDGNLTPGDCCDATCHAEPGCEREPNDDPASAGRWAPSVRGWIRAGDPVDMYRLDVPAGMTAVLDATVAPAASGVTCFDLDSLLEVEDAHGRVLGSDDDGGLATCSHLHVAGLAGTVFVSVLRSPYDHRDNPFFYQLNSTVTYAPCGDGVVDEGQECDDGNRVDGDGCSSTCRFELGAEVEPNDDERTAGGPFRAPFGVHGVIADPSDRDVFAFDLDAYTELTFETFDASGQRSCQGADTALRLWDAAGTLLLSDDDSGGNACARIAPGQLAPGRYYVAVSGFSGPTPYVLRVTALARCGDGVISGGETCEGGPACDARCHVIPPCGDGVVQPPETCDDGNRTPGDGCDANCQREPSCGDGVRQAGEECDDGNHATGDCCDATCHAEAGCEREPNDVATQVTTVLVPPAVVRGSLYPAGDVDVYAFDVSGVATVRLETSGDPSGCLDLDTTLTLLDDRGATVAFDDDGGERLCSRLSVRLEPGHYRVVVAGAAGADPSRALYRLALSYEALCGDGVVQPGEACDGGAGCDARCQLSCGASCPPPVCGDGVRQAGEACDDGNTVAGDGCFACQAEPGHVYEVEPNDDGAVAVGQNDFSATGAEVLPAGTLWVHGALDPAGDEDVFAYTNNSTASVTRIFATAAAPSPWLALANTSATWLIPQNLCGGLDTVLTLRDTAGHVLASDDDSGPDLCSRVSYTLAPGQTVYVQVSDFLDGERIPSYVLGTLPVCGDGVVEAPETCDDGNNWPGDGCSPTCIIEPRCGNGIIEPGEQCDDGNTWGGDGCSWNCQIEPGYFTEREPNNDLASANGNFTQPVTIVGGLPAGDVDDFRVVVDSPTQVTLRVNNADGYSCAGAKLTARDASGAVLAQASDTSPWWGCAQVSVALPAGGVVYAEVSAASAIASYRLHVDLAPSCGNGVKDVAAGEQCDDGNRVSGDGCSADCKLESLCGNGVLDPGETCDDGNFWSGDGCTHCQLEPGHFFELEPNDDALHASGPVSGILTLHGAISPAGDHDFYRVDNPYAGGAQLNLLVDMTPTPFGWSCPAVTMTLLDATGQTIASSASCTTIFYQMLPGTSVYVEVVASDASQQPSYQLRTYMYSLCGDGVKETEIGETCDDGNSVSGDGCSAACQLETPCGNGVLDPGEVCDDGNLFPGDGCSPRCTAEPGHAYEVEPNDDLATAVGNFTESVTIHGSLAPAGDQDYFRFENAGSEWVGLDLRLENGDAFGYCMSPDEIIVHDAQGAVLASALPTQCQLTVPLAPGAVVYAQVTTEPVNGTIVDYRLITEQNPLCGNGVKDVVAGEECDDGNRWDGDGCSANCKLETPCGNGVLDPGEECDDGNFAQYDGCFHCMLEPGHLFEIEPNDAAPGNVTITQTVMMHGALSPAGDVDQFLLENPNGGALVTLWFTDETSYGCPAGLALALRDATGAPLATTSGVSWSGCPATVIALPHGGSAVAAVSAAVAGTVFASYRLQVAYQDLCGNGVKDVSVGEQCDDWNRVDGDGCSAMCQLENPPCGDGIVDPGEECDDGNFRAGDGCYQCKAEPGHAYEREPNDNGSAQVGYDEFSAANANGPFSANVYIHGAVSPAGDDDFFHVVNTSAGGINVNASLSVGSYVPGPFAFCNGVTFLLRYRDAIGHVVATSTTDWTGCPRATVYVPAGGDVYVQVAAGDDATVIPAYLLTLQITPWP